MNISKKKLVVFDLDGTLTESKTPIDETMAGLIVQLLQKKVIAVISGGAFGQFEKQIIPMLRCSDELLKNLFLFPTTGTRFYRYTDHSWEEVYADEMTPQERAKIKDAFEKAFRDINYHHPNQLFGEVIEDRGTQVTFSALGQEAPLDLKKKWRDTQDRRQEIVGALKKYIPEFEIKIPGVTSIDVTRLGIDKAYGIRQMEKRLGITVNDMVFVGDALYEGGNDYAAKTAGVECIPVNGPTDTKQLIMDWLQELSK